MTDEEVKSYLCTQQLTDYREDWPNGKKGCLFLYVNNGSSCNDIQLVIIDTFWRQDASWEDFPTILPIEWNMLFDADSIGLSDYAAISVWALINKREEFETFPDEWDEFAKQIPSLYHPKTIVRSINNFNNFEKTKEILYAIFAGEEYIESFIYIIYTTWESALYAWILNNYSVHYDTKRLLFQNELVYFIPENVQKTSHGLSGLLIPYSMAKELQKLTQRHALTSEKLKAANDVLFSLTSVEITATREVYDTYFEHFCQTYQNQHESDPDFICLQQKERQLVYARAALEQETDYIALSQDIYRYLTPEQGKLLHQYVEGYLTFLKGRIEEIEPAPTLPAVAAATHKNVLPPKGDYKAVMQWLNEQKEMGNYWFKEADYNYEELCRRLSEIFGWVVIANSLIKRIKRDQQ